MKVPKVNFLVNSHLNTIVPIYLAQSLEPNYVRERLDTPDQDFIDLDWINKEVTNQPTLVLFHGTEGSSKSHYAKRIMCYLEQVGWRGVVPHFRGCSEELNRKPRFYHAGETEDMHWILQQIRQRTSKELFTAGVSLGGNTLLKYLGESPSSLVDAAFAISVPFDLLASIEALDSGMFNKHIYVKHFLNTLLPKMKEYAKQFGTFDYIERKIETLDEFNNTYICQIFQFKDVLDYYQQASCRSYLKHIITPTLILQAENDPMIPVSSWPNKEELSPMIKFVGTKTGGHAGFLTMSKNYKEALLKLPKFMVEYLSQFTLHKVSTLAGETTTFNFMENN
jgi:predicted alpha/beta-fold hydrolase